MNRLLLLFAALAVSAMVHAQDLIIFRNGDEQQVRVLEISDSEVRYKTWSNQSGPTRTKSTSDIFMIKYSDGTKETFADKAPSQQTAGALSRKASAPPSVAPKIVPAVRDHRMEVGIRVRPVINMLFLTPDDINVKSGVGMRFFGALGGTFDWYVTDNPRNPWLVHTALEYSLQGGSFKSYNGTKYRMDYINLDLGYGLRSRIVSWNFGVRLGFLTSAKLLSGNNKIGIYDSCNPAAAGIFTNFGFCAGKHVDFGVSFGYTFTNAVKFDAWKYGGSTTQNFQCGWYVTYRFNINKQRKTEE